MEVVFVNGDLMGILTDLDDVCILLKNTLDLDWWFDKMEYYETDFSGFMWI